MTKATSQAARLIAKCGGVHVVARICGVDVSRVHRWAYDKSRGGSGGLIPARLGAGVDDGARARGIDLSPADFFDADFPIDESPVE
jgi:hypothetical protein